MADKDIRALFLATSLLAVPTLRADVISETGQIAVVPGKAE